MSEIETLSIDIETFSSVDLSKCGVYKYVESPDFDILLFGYSVDGGGIRIADLVCGDKLPEKILDALTDGTVTKWAFNAQFERICISAWLWKNYPERFESYSIPQDTVGDYLDPASWRCSRVWAAYLGLPLSLEGAGAAIGLERQKLSEGKDLIRYFSVPCAPTKANGGRTRNLPQHAPDKWKAFKEYNARDVEVEMAIKEKLRNFPVPDSVWEEYRIDQEINDRGVGIDLTLVGSAIRMDGRSRSELTETMKRLTGLENPNSVTQLRQWLSENGLPTESLGKKEVARMLETAPSELAGVLTLRQQMAKSSVKKYTAMENAACADGRARGMFQFYGANRTGRWAGRLIQLQNLPQNHLSDLDQARSLVRSGDYDAVEMLYGDVPGTLSQLVRTAFIPRPGYKFIVADFSSVEARVLAWLAGETWRTKVFEEGQDIYSMTASRMFGVPVEKHGVNADLRQKGKIAELACIAEGQPVLTDKGLIPIEKVTTDEKVWDGENWVEHGGIVFRGEREVITYDGLTATADHMVWIEGKPEPVRLGFAAANGAHLIQTGDGRKAIRLGEDHQPGETMERSYESLLCSDTVSGLREHPMAEPRCTDKRKIKRLSALFPETKDSDMAAQASYRRETALRESFLSWLRKLWGPWHQVQFSKCDGSRALSDSNVWPAGQENGDRPDQHELELRARESSICIPSGKLRKSAEECPVGVQSGILAVRTNRSDQKTFSGNNTGRDNTRCGNSSARKTEKLENHKRTARLYDIRDAGPNHRFTVSGKLVHNCGYGGSTGALKAMGALEMGLQEEELQPLVDAWRNSNPHITKLWWDIDRAAMDAVRMHMPSETAGIKFSYQSGMLFITLPSGRKLSYVKPRIGVNRFGNDCITYEGIGPDRKWERLDTYGPKLTENIVQGISRDLLAYAMRTLSHCFIVMHVHDELVIEADPRVSVEALAEQMGRTPPWAEGLNLRADGFETYFYKKD